MSGSTVLEDAGPRPSRRLPGGRRLLGVLPLVIPVVVLAVMGWERRWMSDDGFINMRVVDNVFAGHGPVFNVGERVEVGTSTLWMGILLLGHLLTPFAEPSQFGVYGGLVASVLGLALATWASLTISRRLGRSGPAVPLGAAVVAVLPPFWDFATSGLETGIAFLWLGGAYALLVHRWAADEPGTPAADRRSGWRPLWPAVVIGLGPLVRPDLALVAAALGIALLAQSRRGVRSWVGTVLAAAALPLLYEVFRAGYYAALVPNTALAKGAASAQWANGLRYLADFALTYALVVPAAVLLLVWLWQLTAVARTRDVPTVALLAAPVVGGALHALYVVRLGGDFMHARFLLPATFAMCLPVAVGVVGRSVLARLAIGASVVAVAAWAVVAGATLRPDYLGAIGPGGIADERGVYVAQAVDGNPVRLEDYSTQGWYVLGEGLRSDADAGRREYVDPPAVLPVSDGYDVAVRYPNIGILGTAAGPDVLVADSLSLADPVGARLSLPEPAEPRAGHSHSVPPAWQQARYAAPGDGDDADTQAARRALGCGELAELQEAVTAPMSVSRFLENLVAAPRFTMLSIPGDPQEAVEEFCG